jgi:hypothetical protein
MSNTLIREGVETSGTKVPKKVNPFRKDVFSGRGGSSAKNLCFREDPLLIQPRGAKLSGAQKNRRNGL